MKSQFITELDLELCPGSDGIWTLKSPLVYYSDLLKYQIVVPHSYPAVTFYTDLSSVPRIPLIYEWWGNKAHREAVIHDYLYRRNSIPVVSFMMANRVMLEAMIVREKPVYIRQPIFIGVCLGGYPSYHRKDVETPLTKAEIK